MAQEENQTTKTYLIRQDLLELERNDYHEHLLEFDQVLDCSMGSNPYGTPLLNFDTSLLERLNLYPEFDEELKAAICKYFAPAADISPEHVQFSCGSIGTVSALNRVCLKPGVKVICTSPTFTAVLDDMKTYGVDFIEVPLRPDANYELNIEDLITAIKENPHSYIYIDNPNNPTGQIYDLKDLRRCAKAAQEADSFIVIDEAYGDYMDNENSALCLYQDFENLACVRTFSKALGGAGVRLGYLVANENIMRAFNKVNLPYSKSSIAHAFAMQTLASTWREDTRLRVKHDKAKLLACLSNIKVAHTSLNTPISMLYLENKDVNLELLLQQVGIKVVTCAGYNGLGPWAIRLNLNKDLETLVKLISQADTLAGQTV